MTNQSQSAVEAFIQAELDRRYASTTVDASYALECADVVELRNYPAVPSALPATHKSLGSGYVLFEGFVDGSHVVLFQAEKVDVDRAGRNDRFVSKHGVAGYVGDTLRDVCAHIGDTDVVERAIDSYLFIDGLNWYAANPGGIVVHGRKERVVCAPQQPVAPQRVPSPVIEVSSPRTEEEVPAWLAQELGGCWEEYETVGWL